MDKLIYLKKMIRYIETNLNRKISPEHISHVGFISLMQLYRDFYAYTGHSIKEYIRKRRLSNALAMVKFSDMSLADIAYSCGYSSQQAFCKYVKNATGQTALEYKKSDAFFYFPPFKGDLQTYISVASEMIPKTILCKFYHSQIKGIENRAVSHLLTILPGFNGRIFGRNGKQSGSKFCYELYIALEDDLKQYLKNSQFWDMELRQSHSATYATVSVRNIDKEISRAWDYLYTNWLQASMFEQAERPYFEEYMIKKGQVAKLKLYLPIKKKEAYCEIKVKSCAKMSFLVSKKFGADAEEVASRTVINFLRSYYPHILKRAKEFFVSKQHDGYICGVRLEDGLSLPQNSNMELLTFPNGQYAVLEDYCSGDGSVHERRLVSWVDDNGFARDAFPVFIVYKTDGGFASEDIQMKIYCRLKNVKNG